MHDAVWDQIAALVSEAGIHPRRRDLVDRLSALLTTCPAHGVAATEPDRAALRAILGKRFLLSNSSPLEEELMAWARGEAAGPTWCEHWAWNAANRIWGRGTATHFTVLDDRNTSVRFCDRCGTPRPVGT